MSNSIIQSTMQLLSLLLIELLGANGKDQVENDIIETAKRELNKSVHLNNHFLNFTDTGAEKLLKNSDDAKKTNRESQQLDPSSDDFDADESNTESPVNISPVSKKLIFYLKKGILDYYLLLTYDFQVIKYKNELTQIDFRERIKITNLKEELTRKNLLIESLQAELRKEKIASEERKVRDDELMSMLKKKLTETLELKNKLLVEREILEDSFINGENSEISGKIYT